MGLRTKLQELGHLLRDPDVRSDRAIRRHIRRHRRWSLGDLPEATWGRVIGCVGMFEGHVLQAPLTGRRCVAYAIRIEDLRAPLRFRYLLARQRHSVPFLLEAGDEHAVVDPKYALFAIAFDFQVESKAAFDATKAQRALLEQHNLVQRDWFATQAVRYREAVIELGASIAVLGSGTREPDPGREPETYRDGSATRLQLAGSARFPLSICDRPEMSIGQIADRAKRR